MASLNSLPFWDSGGQDPRRTEAGPLGQLPSYPGIQSFIPEFGEWLEDGLSSWEVVYFNNVRVPGLARIDGGKRRLIDHRGTPGSSGEIASLMAYALAEFTITLTLWTAVQWAELQNLMDTFYPKEAPVQVVSASAPLIPSKVPTVSVRHPAFQLLKVTDVYVVDVRVPRHIGSQVMEVVIDCVELKLPSNEGVKQQAAVIETAPNVFNAAQPRSTPPGPDKTNANP